MKAEKTIKHIERTDKWLGYQTHDYIYAELHELERLARIGLATEKALKDQEYCIASYKGNHVSSFKTIRELLEWYDA